MELSKKQIKATKGVAILFMLLLHLFCTKTYEGLFTPSIFIGNTPLIYYFALFGDCCVAIYCFCSGYGLFLSYENNNMNYNKNNRIRILKLYINTWIVLFLFVIVLGAVTRNSSVYPINIKEFLLTVTLINPAYNGAWWFLTTYILLVILSSCINKIVKKYNSIVIIFILFIIYFMAYIQRIKGVLNFDNVILEYMVRQLVLLGTSLFPYIIGVIFAYKNIYSKVYTVVNKFKYKNIIIIALISLMIIIHGIVQGLFVAVFTGIAFICLFNLLDKPQWINKLLLYLSNHSTNMWLIHMFLYRIYFRKLVFLPKYPIAIYIYLIILSLLCSYVVKLIYNPIIKLLDMKNNKVKINEKSV